MITVSIPTIGSHLKEHFLEAIHSAVAVDASLISQILILDNSADQSYSEFLKELSAKDSRIEYHYQSQKLNLAENLNRGVEFCKNGWILFLCDDDGLYPESFKNIKEHLNENLAMLSFDFHVKDQNGEREVKRLPGMKGILANTPKLVSTVFNVQKFKEAGMWNNSFGYFLDLLLYMNIEKNFSTKYVSRSLGFHRQHADNASHRSHREAGYGKAVPVAVSEGMKLLEDVSLQREFLFHVMSYAYPHKTFKSRFINGIVRFIFRNNAWLKNP